MAIVDQVVSECWASSVICIVDSDRRRSSISMAADAEVEPDFKIEPMMYTRVSGGGLGRRSVLIPQAHTTDEGGTAYLHVTCVPNFAQALFAPNIGGVSDIRRKGRPLAGTDIVLQLRDLRNATIKSIIDDLLPKRVELVGATSAPASKWSLAKRKNKAFKQVAGTLPKYITVLTPTIGDVQGVYMRMRVSPGGLAKAPLFIELTPANIKYVREVCCYQIASGTVIKRTRKLAKTTIKRARRTSSTIANGRRDDLSESDERDDEAPDADIVATSSPILMETPVKRTSARVGNLTDFFKSSRV